jgi:hypothetical protein
MTTVSGTLKMFDAMSGPLKNITSSMNLMISSMQKMQNETNRNVKIDQSLKAAKQQIAAAEADIKKQIDEAAKAQERFSKSTKGSGEQANQLLQTVKGIAATYLTLSGIKQLGSSTIGAGMEQQAQIDTFAARTGNEAQGRDIFNTISKDSLKYGQDVQSSLLGAQSFLSNTMDPSKLKELNTLAMRLSKLNPTEGMEGAAFSLKELMSGDYTSIAERFNISRNMLKDSEARAAGLKGDVEGFIKGMDKLLNQQNMTQEAFEKMLDSPSARWSKILNTFKFNLASAGRGALSAIDPLLKTINKAIDKGSFNGFFKALQTGLRIVSEILGAVVNSLMWLFNVVKQNAPFIIGVLTTIGTVLLVQMIARLWAMIPALWAAIPPLYAQAAAWLAINWPILLVAAAIGIIVAVLLYFGVTAEQVVGAVVGFFYGLYASLMNIIALIWNLFATFAEFLVNLFIDPVFAIKNLFYDLGQTFGEYMVNMVRSAEDFAGGFTKTILSAVNKALDGINWFINKANEIFGTDFKTAGHFDTSNPHAISDKMKSYFDSIEAPTSDKAVVSIDRMGQKNVHDYYQKGNVAGSNAVGNLKKSLSGVNDLMNASKEPYNLGNSKGLGDIDKIGKVGQVDKIKDKVDISSEDLKTMRELAEMKSVQNFISLTPTVSVQTGDINNGYDVDTIVSRITDNLENQIASSAKGVYGV